MPAPDCRNGVTRGLVTVAIAYVMTITLQAMKEGFKELSSSLKISSENILLFFAFVAVISILDFLSQGLKAKYWPTDYAICVFGGMLMGIFVFGYFEVGFIILGVFIMLWLWRRFTKPTEYRRRW